MSARSRARSIAKPCSTLEQHMSRTRPGATIALRFAQRSRRGKTKAIPSENLSDLPVRRCELKGYKASEQYQPTARGHGTSWSRYHRCLAESHDLPALSRLHQFRLVDVRFPHLHAVRPAVDLGPTSSERTQHRHGSDAHCFCGYLNRSGTDSGKGLS